MMVAGEGNRRKRRRVFLGSRDRAKIGLPLLKTQFDVGVSAPPQERNPRRPIFAVDGLPRVRVICRRQDPRRGRMLRAGDFAADRAGRDLYLRIIPYALGLAHIATRHDVELAIVLSEPDRGRNSDSALAESFQRNVFLT